jgi:pimeloyl-ACP methyl ester carboxylesterase
VAILAVPALAFTLATFILAALWRLGLRLLRRSAPGFWRRTLRWHAALFVLHFFVTVPLILGVLLGRGVGTRGDERAYAGPRIAADGTWIEQSRESLAAERRGEAKVDPALVAAASQRAVSLTAADGVPLRAFLVPPAAPAGAPPRFVAVLVHGLFRGALEIETPARMLRELGGETVLLELRNHGGSGRARPTFGRDESLDVLAAASFLRARPEAQGRPLILFGVSLGTAAAAIAAPRIPDLAGLVLDAPIDDLEATARRELRSGGLARSILEPWASTILLSARFLGGVPITEVKPGKALAGLRPEVVVLLVGAGKDDRIPPASVQALFDSLPTPPNHKQIWIEPAATHGKVWAAAPEEYRRRLAQLCTQAIEGTEPLPR